MRHRARWTALAAVLVGLACRRGRPTPLLEPPTIHLPAPASGTTIRLPTAWAVGDRLEIDTVFQAGREHGPKHGGARLGGVHSTIEVTEHPADGYVLSWNTRIDSDPALETDVPSSAPDPERMARLLGELARAIGSETLLIRTDAGGHPQRLLNTADVLEARTRGVQTILDRWRPSLPPEALARAGAMMAHLSPEMLEQTSLALPIHFLGACGLSLKAGTPTPVATSMLDLVTAGTVPTDGMASLDGLDTAAGVALVVVRATVPPDLAWHLHERLARADRPTPPEFRITAVSEYLMDLRTGWPVQVVTTTRLEAGDDVRLRQVQHTCRQRPAR